MPVFSSAGARLTLAGSTVLVVLGVAACGSGQPNASPSSTSTVGPVATTTTSATAEASTTAPSTSASTAAPSPSAGPDVRSAQRLIASVALTDRDLASGLKLQLLEQGDQLKDVTLDNCGYHYSTEAHRIARHQTAVLTAKGEDTGVSNEVVAYDSEAQAAKALQEYRDSVRHCVLNRDIPPAGASQPVVRYLSDTLSHNSKLPVKDNVVAIASVQVKGGAKVYNISILQRSGVVLDNIYLNQPAKINSDVRTAVLQLAAVTGARLARQQAATV